MKRMILVLFLAVISITAFCVTDSTSTELPLNVSGNSFKELIMSNWTVILTFILYAIWEFALGETSKVKSNSTVKLVYTWIMNFLKKKAGKITIIVVVFAFLGAGLSVNAQNPFKGFFNPKQEVLSEQYISVKNDGTININTGIYLFRAAATVSGFAVPVKDSESVSSFQIAGMGLSYGYYTTEAYCKYAINAFIVSNLKLGDLTSAKAGGLMTVGFFNNYLNVGMMYACPDKNYNFYITTGLTYTF